MSRQFGLSSRPALGAETTQGGPLFASRGSRESIIHLAEASVTLDDAIKWADSGELRAEHFLVMERAAKWFIIFCGLMLGAAGCALLWVISLILYYAGSDSPF